MELGREGLRGMEGGKVVKGDGEIMRPEEKRKEAYG